MYVIAEKKDLAGLDIANILLRMSKTQRRKLCKMKKTPPF